jgi:hypothetical protein
VLAVPLQGVPSQSLSVVLGDQNCQINVYVKSTGVYIDLYVSNAPIVTATICRDRVRLVREKYLSFLGDLAFVDTEGTSDPRLEGLGSRFILAYIQSNDL